PATVVVTYPDGSTDEVPAKVQVKDLTDAEKNTPQAKDQTVKVGETPKAEDSIANLKDLPQGTKVAYKEPVDTKTPGDKPATVVVTYPDGSSEEVPAKVQVKDLTDAEKNTPQAKDQTVKVGETPKAEDSIANLKDLPQGTKVAYKEPVDTKTPGEKPATVVVTYPDGSTDEVPVNVKVNDLTDAEKNTPQAKDQTVKVGETPKAEDSIANLKDLPQGTKVAYKEPVDTKTPGDKPATVVVTYPDGSTDEVPAKVQVKDLTDAEKNNPQGQDINTKVGQTPNAKDGIKDADKLPQGTKFDFKEPVDTKTPGDKPATVVVTYPDGSKDEVPVNVKVSENPTQAETTDPTVPAKTEVEDKTNLTPEEQGKVKKAIEDANKDKFPAPKEGQNPTTVEVGKDGTATITYPDGSKDTIPGTDLVVERPKTTVEGTPKTVKPSKDPQDTGLVVKNQDDKTPTKVTAKDEDGQDVPVTVDPATGKVSVTPGTKVDGPITVTVEDKDLPGGKQDFVVPVEGHEAGRDDNGTDKTQADLTDPVVPAEKTPVADKTNLTEDEKAQVKKAIEDANKDKFPAPKEGQNPTTVEVGKDGTATITYPDGSKDTIPGTDLVREKTNVDAKNVKPVNPTDDKQGTGIKVNNPDKDTTVTAKDEDGKDVPVVINPETGEVEVTPGTNVDGPIVVTINDPDLPGGKQEVTVPVKGHEAGRDDNGSDKTQADLTDPVVPAEKTPVADKTNLTEDEKAQVKKAIEDANKDKFPAPKDGQKPTTVEIGKDGTATITYPDGSKDTIPGTDLVREKTNVDDSAVKEVNPSDEKQGTGIKVNNADKDTTVTAKDEDGKVVPAVINPETGEVEVTPGKDVDGPITVTITDPELPGGKKEVTVPVKGHKAGHDDNGSDQSAKPTIEAIHEGDEIVEGNGVPDAKIVVKDKEGKVIGETTVDGIGNWSVKVPANKLFAGDKVTVEQTEEGKKPAVETATVQKATGETTRKGDPAVAYPIESHPVVKHVGDSLTADDITKAIKVVGVPEGSYKVTINEGQTLPSTDKVGDAIIDVTVTLPDGTTEAAQVWVIVKAQGGALLRSRSQLPWTTPKSRKLTQLTTNKVLASRSTILIRTPQSPLRTKTARTSLLSSTQQPVK
ncbi:Rib/alpha-like domain-containing protein, partial [Aerococcus sp. UMB1112A]|uniref:Rib/alpha-like domain-containing protein n=1 Tax=Aerococcus sp. UMB1112A TaxID=3050609 RepID=UPI00254E7330